MYKLNLLNNKKYFYYKLNNKNQIILKKFIDLNLISYVKCIDNKNNLFKIYITYIKNKPLYTNIKILYRISTPFYVNLKTLETMKTYKYNSIYLLFTSKGILTNIEAVSCKIGGILFCTFRY
jgi:ribosomal protein S8